MAKQCKGKTRSGQPCKMRPVGGGDYCFTHSPDTRAKQAAARKLGGFNRATPHAGKAETVNRKPRSIEETFSILDYVLAETLAMDNGIQRNRLMVAIATQYVDACKVGELEAQLRELLRVLENRKG